MLAMLMTARAQAEFPPIQWGGEIGFTYRATMDEQDNDTSQLAPLLRLYALSYIYEPWFATWYTDLSVSYTQVTGTDLGTDSQIISGAGQIDFFPQSRFPGQLFVDVTDSRIDATEDALELGEYRLTRYGYDQRYQSTDSNMLLHGRYEGTHETRLQTGDEFDIQQLEMDGSYYLGNHRFDGNALAQQTTRDPQGEDTRNYFANLGHSYSPNPNLYATTNLALTRNEADSESGDASLSSIGLNNAVTWQATDKFRFDSNLILDHVEREFGPVGQLDEDLAELSLRGIYDVLTDLTLSGEVAGSVRRVGDTDNQRTRQVLTLDYSPEPIVFDPFIYTYSLGAGARNRTDDAAGDSQSYRVGGSQGLGYTKVFGEGGWTMMLDGTQTVEHNEDTQEGPLTTLSHQASVTLSSSDESGNTYGLLSFLDYRNFGRSEIALQQLTTTLNHTQFLDRYQSVSGTLSGTAGRTTDADVTASYYFASASAGYFKQRLFGVRNLQFSSQLTGDYTFNRVERDDFALDPGLDIGLPDLDESENYRVSWRNELDYTIGLLTARLITDIQQTDTGDSWQVFLRVTRSF